MSQKTINIVSNPKTFWATKLMLTGTNVATYINISIDEAVETLKDNSNDEAANITGKSQKSKWLKAFIKPGYGTLIETLLLLTILVHNSTDSAYQAHQSQDDHDQFSTSVSASSVGTIGGPLDGAATPSRRRASSAYSTRLNVNICRIEPVSNTEEELSPTGICVGDRLVFGATVLLLLVLGSAGILITFGIVVNSPKYSVENVINNSAVSLNTSQFLGKFIATSVCIFR